MSDRKYYRQEFAKVKMDSVYKPNLVIVNQHANAEYDAQMRHVTLNRDCAIELIRFLLFKFPDIKLVDAMTRIKQSCEQAISGEWEVNDEGFHAMIDDIDISMKEIME